MGCIRYRSERRESCISLEGKRMPRIPNFPQALLDEHRVWHHTNHLVPGTIPPPGYGDRFLKFHRDFINRVYSWHDSMGYDRSWIAGWNQVPEEIRRSSCFNPGAEQRVQNNPRSFATADQLGSFIEYNLHGCFHEMAARLYNQPELNDFDLAPRNTEFYNIHGLIDQWYSNWERTMGVRDPASKSRASLKYNRAETEVRSYNKKTREARIASPKRSAGQSSAARSDRRAQHLTQKPQIKSLQTMQSALLDQPHKRRPLLQAAAEVLSKAARTQGQKRH